MRWTEEQRKKKSEQMSEFYKDPDNVQKIRDGWKNVDSYKKNEGKHQLESPEQRRAYQREYHRKWYKRNKGKVAKWTKDYYERKKLEVSKTEKHGI